MSEKSVPAKTRLHNKYEAEGVQAEMKTMNSEYMARIEHWTRTLKDDFYEPLGEIDFEASRTMEELSLEQAKELDYVPVKPGYTWGKTWEYCWFRTQIKLGQEAAGKRIVLNLAPGGESALFLNGKSFGTYRAEWVSVWHHYIEDNTLTRCAEENDEFEFYMETYAGQYYPVAPSGECGVGPVLPGSYQDPLKEGERRVLGVSTYGIWNEDAYQLYMDVATIGRLLEVVEPTSLRAVKLARALEEFTLIVDFEQEKEARIRTYREAREMLRPILEAENGSTQPTFYAIGNAHLDLAWLWPMQETYRKTSRTFAQQLRLLEEYPEYRFVQSQPAAYEMCRKYYPELFERILEAIKKGQWIADGAMWVEPDTNMAGGEALIRQLLYGLAYYRDVLGVESQVLWLPDTFGYTGALPQILKSCGVKYLVTQKIFWSYNDGEQFPYHYFNWEGIDGTQVTAFLPTSYVYKTDPKEIAETWQKRVQVRDLDAFLLPYGYGDGGGGPTRDHVEYIRRESNLEGMPKVKNAAPLTFFKDMEAAGGPVNTYCGELYFTAHRGTFTVQAMVKKNNRRAEAALREMELWGSYALKCSAQYDQEKAEEYWKELLLHQFHDILPGTCIARVYEEAIPRVQKLIENVEEQTSAYQAELLKGTEGVTLFNSLSHERTEVIVLPQCFAEGAKTADGEEIPVQTIALPGQGQGVAALVTVPSVGGITVLPGHAEKTAQSGAFVRREGNVFILENEKLTAKIDEKGEVVSCIWKASGREFAAGPMNHFRMYKDVPRLFDAWDIDSNYIEQEITAAEQVTVEIVNEGGLAASVRVRGKIQNSEFTQDILLKSNAERIEFATTVDWKELHRLLKVSFPVTVYTENGINEMQFGYVQRPTKRSRQYEKDRFEVCNHRYSALCDGSHGAAILNDCKYGISMNENALELTLLRAGAGPEMRSDNHVHTFTYAFAPWEGSFMDSNIVEQGYELNMPISAAEGALAEGSSFSLVQIEKPNVILETMKPAEDGTGDLILRFYESKKAAVQTAVHTAFDGEVYLCDMLENPTEKVVSENGTFSLDFGVFEIKTVRIKDSSRK